MNFKNTIDFHRCFVSESNSSLLMSTKNLHNLILHIEESSIHQLLHKKGMNDKKNVKMLEIII